MTNKELVEKALNIAKNYTTLYVMGCIGAPLKGANIIRYCNNHTYNTNPARRSMIINAGNRHETVFGFDCVCLIKSILWGWTGDTSKTYGGAIYASNGVPDINADAMIKVCKDVSTDFSHIELGEVVWMPGHIGIYIGDGLAVECSPSWENSVQITACNRNINCYNRRDWSKHGKLPYINYISASLGDDITIDKAPGCITEVAKLVLAGKFGNGAQRKENIYKAVQAEVNRLMG